MPARFPAAFAAALLACLLGCVAGCSGTPAVDLGATEQRSLQAAAGRAEVVAVSMYADWCPICEDLDPKVGRAVAAVGDGRVRFVQADLTDARRPGVEPAGARTLVDMGLGELYEKNGRRTGVVYLVDAETGEVLDAIGGRGRSEAEIARRLRSALAAAG